MRREPLPILTRAESEIMAVLWKHGRGTVHEVVSALARPVAYTTVFRRQRRPRSSNVWSKWRSAKRSRLRTRLRRRRAGS
ncbi:BlaI/MecI/CopY family transcriptional regulator [Sorangium sp. So ce291]|uniref:BlaI/MecI/CopY family transcriptional regulator n=1 Tax=Sorangium sp. So ce291 TaxID=3133294 RepID=UPI003F61B594